MKLDCTVMVLHGVLDDGKAEARAAVPPGQRGVGLFERLEQLRQQGYETAVCWTAEEAMDTIAGYLGVMEQTGRKVEE